MSKRIVEKFARSMCRRSLERQFSTWAPGQLDLHVERDYKLYYDDARDALAAIAEILWYPIETVPFDTQVMLWWVPVTPNPFAEAVVIGQISSDRPGAWWNSQTATYQDVKHVTHWAELPPGPGQYRRRHD